MESSYMFPNSRIEKYYSLCKDLLDFKDVSWWLIDLDDDPGVFYCNTVMCSSFDLDSSLLAHSVMKTCPIAGDYNKNIAIRNSKLAKQIFFEYQQLRHGEIEEYSNRFPYYDQRVDEIFYYSSRAKALVRNDDGSAALLLGIIEPEMVSSELYLRAKTDGLTGLLNRREFDSQIEFLIQLASRNNLSVSMIMCDIDNFKKYNDSLGHCAGDECLKHVSSVLKNVFSRSIDQVFRYGGEEFAVLIIDDMESIPKLSETLCQEINALDLYHSESNTNKITVSVGYATVRPGADSLGKELIVRADKALYEAKSQGKNRSCSFDSDVKKSL